MVNWQNPETMEAEFVVDVTLAHILSGLYIWEWIMHIAFDYKLATSSKEFRWPVAAYLACRATALLLVIITLFVLNVAHEINCEVYYTLCFVFGYIGVALSSTLLALRTIVIWHHNKVVFWLIALLLVAYYAILVYAVVDGPRTTWSSSIGKCIFSHSLRNRVNYMYGLIFDAGSLVLALIGVLGHRTGAHGGLWTTIYHQGIIWIAVVVALYTVPLVFLWLNLNDVMNVIFQYPSALATVIAATRMYRNLYIRGHSDVVHWHTFSETVPRLSTLRGATNRDLSTGSTEFDGRDPCSTVI